MAYKHKYPRRPLNDGDRWIDGVRHSVPRQRRSDPLHNHVSIEDTESARQSNVGPDKSAQWKPMCKRTVLEYALSNRIDPEHVEQAIDRGTWHRVAFRKAFLKGIQDGVVDGTITNHMELFSKFRSCLVGWGK